MANILELFRLDGKKAIVTGASGGIGQKLVEALAEAGAEVAVTGVSDKVFALAEKWRAQGHTIHAFQADLGDPAQREDFFNKAVEALGGRLDILVNNAGVQHRCEAENFPQDQWDRVMATNVDAVFFLAQMAGQKMLAQGGGKIVNICSLSATFGGRKIPAYTASKCAVQGITRSLSNEWAGRGICVNAISPGYMATDLTSTMDPAQREVVTARIPLGRWGDGTELKGAVVFLASAASDYVSGESLVVDGGFSAS